MSLEEGLTKSGAVVSSAGVGLLIMFVVVLLAFPVIKECGGEVDRSCSFSSTAPEPFRSLVQPSYLAASLLVIAAGVFMVRFGRWRESKKSKNR